MEITQVSQIGQSPSQKRAHQSHARRGPKTKNNNGAADFPMHYQIILTEKCNSQCKYCYKKSLQEFKNGPEKNYLQLRRTACFEHRHPKTKNLHKKRRASNNNILRRRITLTNPENKRNNAKNTRINKK